MSNARQLAANLPREGGFGVRNFIINGEMQVAQRGTSVSFGHAYTLDRWRIVGGASPARVATQENNTSYSTVPHEKFLKCTNPQGQDMWTTQRIENARQFSGKTLTISYWVWSTTGSYSATSGSWGALQAANSNQYNVSGWGGASVSVTTTPQFVTHTINFADISSYTHTEGDFFEWNIYHSTTNDICITGVQLELGDTATPFEHRSYGDELARCERYLKRLNVGGSAYIGAVNYGSFLGQVKFSEMRATPSLLSTGMTGYGSGNTEYRVYIFNSSGGGFLGAPTTATLLFNYATNSSGRIEAYVNPSWYNSAIDTAGAALDIGAGVKLLLDAEL